METRKFEMRQLLKEKKFWVASFLIVWAAGLQGHMMWLQRQKSFKEKFGNVNSESDSVVADDIQGAEAELKVEPEKC